MWLQVLSLEFTIIAILLCWKLQAILLRDSGTSSGNCHHHRLRVVCFCHHYQKLFPFGRHLLSVVMFTIMNFSYQRWNSKPSKWTWPKQIRLHCCIVKRTITFHNKKYTFRDPKYWCIWKQDLFCVLKEDHHHRISFSYAFVLFQLRLSFCNITFNFHLQPCSFLFYLLYEFFPVSVFRHSWIFQDKPLLLKSQFECFWTSTDIFGCCMKITGQSTIFG